MDSVLIPLAVLLFGFCLGGVFASYFNVVVVRGLKLSLFDRSHCDNCERKLSPLELIPVVSIAYIHLFQGGESKCCNKSISLKYLFTELLGSISVGLLALNLVQFISDKQLSTGLIFSAIYLVVISLTFLYLAVEDIWELHINSLVMYSMIGLSLVYGLIDHFLLNTAESLFASKLFSISTLLAISIYGGLILILIYLTKGKGMGLGDFFLMVFIGLSLGVWQTTVAFQIAVYLASVVGITMGVVRKQIKGTIVPLVPFLLIGWQLANMYTGEILEFLFGYNLQNLL